MEGRSRSAVAAVRALALAGYRPEVGISRRRSAAALSRSCAGVVVLPSPESAGYRAAVLAAVTSRRHVLTLAASDAALSTLQGPGVHLIDKSALPAIAAAAGFRVPETRVFASPAELEAQADTLRYPAVIKATVKAEATTVARRVNHPSAVADLARQMTGALVAQQFLSGDLRAVAGVIYEGELRAVVHQAYVRIWPPECGVASAAITTGPDLDVEARLPRLLGGHSGIFQTQLIGDYLIDVNPRAYGSMPLAVAAGVNLPAIACAAHLGEQQELVRGRSGVRYRWLEGDVRRLVHDARAGRLRPVEALQALRPRRHTAHSVESLLDPLPALSRVVDVARRWR